MPLLSLAPGHETQSAKDRQGPETRGTRGGLEGEEFYWMRGYLYGISTLVT